MAAQILIVEDEPPIQELIAVNLARAGHKTQCVADAESAHHLLRTWMPDLMLLDWMLPGMSGLDFTRMLRSESGTRDLPIIMLTARDEERDMVTGLEIGADDYITKPFSPRELLARIGVILRRRAPNVSSELVRIRDLTIDPIGKTAMVGSASLSLGATEFKLLHFLCTHSERVYSRSQLIYHVWGMDFRGDDRTVDVHISRLRNALEPGGMNHLIRTVRGSGYSLTLNS